MHRRDQYPVRSNSAIQFTGIATLLLLLTLLAGCAGSRGGIEATQPLQASVDLDAYRYLTLELSQDDEVPLSAENSALIGELILTKIEKQAPGKYSFDPPSPGRDDVLKLSLHFTRYDKGNALARFVLTGLGQIHIDAQLDLTDADSQQLLAEYDITKTFAWGGVIGVVTRIEDVQHGFAEAVAATLLDDEARQKAKERAAKKATRNKSR